MNGDSPAGGKSADTRRTERVALANRILQQVWATARHQDEREWGNAEKESSGLVEAAQQYVQTLKDEAEAARKG